MSFCNEEELEKCIADLEERAKPSKNDLRYEKYVECINCFISKFGKEQVHLVGSTSERSKLAYSKDDGDADFLIVSGKMEIPVENLIQNQHAPCYMWIEADALSKEIGCEIVQDRYLSNKTLRDVKPELFTISRAIYSHVTSKMDKIAEEDDQDNVVVLKVSSKVGLQTTSYGNLKLDERIKDIRKRFPSVGKVKSRSIHTERLKDLKIHDSDKKIYKRLYEVAKVAISQNGKSLDYEGIGFLIQCFGEKLLQENYRHSFTPQNATSKCPNNKMSQDDGCVLYQNDLDCDDFVKSNKAVFRATFSSTDHKDFVPALKIKGTLNCMQSWKTRVERLHWPSEIVDRIYNSQVFVVARISPVNSNPEKDFCLSFNLPEKEMMNLATPTQMRVFWIMKAFLKGIFNNYHERKKKEMKLKTYHIKHVFFWIYEEKEASEMQSVPSLLRKTLLSLMSALRVKKLRHYFVENNNLFVDFEDEDFELLLKCVDEVMSRPVESLKIYIELNQKNVREVWLTEEEMIYFLERRSDGGRNEYIEKFEDAMLDFQRGVNEMRNINGCSPLIEAIVDTLKLCIHDYGNVDLLMVKRLNDVLINGQTDQTQIDEHKAHKNIKDCIALIKGLCFFLPTLRSHIDQFGGTDGVRHILWGAFCGKRLDMDTDLGEQIVDALRRYLSCPDGEEETLCSELKYKLLCFFLFREEFSDLTGIRNV